MTGALSWKKRDLRQALRLPRTSIEVLTTRAKTVLLCLPDSPSTQSELPITRALKGMRSNVSRPSVVPQNAFLYHQEASASVTGAWMRERGLIHSSHRRPFVSESGGT